MKNLTFAIKRFFIRNYDAIKIGLLIGLLITNFIMLDKQSKTVRELLSVSSTIQAQIEADNEAREVARKEADNRSSVILDYLRCIVLLKPEERTETAVDNCLEDKITPATQNAPRQNTITATPVAPTPQPTPPVEKQPPTTSEPPEPQEPSVINRLFNTVDNLIKEVL